MRQLLIAPPVAGRGPTQRLVRLNVRVEQLDESEGVALRENPDRIRLDEFPRLRQQHRQGEVADALAGQGRGLLQQRLLQRAESQVQGWRIVWRGRSHS